MLSQVSASRSITNRLGLPRLYENEDYFGAALQLDGCLDRWEKNLSQSLRHDIFQVGVDDSLQRRRVALHLRSVEPELCRRLCLQLAKCIHAFTYPCYT